MNDKMHKSGFMVTVVVNAFLLYFGGGNVNPQPQK